MRTYGRLLVATLVLMLLVCPAAYSQDRGLAQETSFFTGWTFDVAPFYLWIPAHWPRRSGFDLAPRDLRVDRRDLSAVGLCIFPTKEER
jgi:hypothetical protein